MRVVKDAVNKVLAIVGLVALGIVGVALLGAGLIVGLAVVGLLAVAYVVAKIFFKDRVSVRTMRIASCPSCGRITNQRICDCGQRVSWL